MTVSNDYTSILSGASWNGSGVTDHPTFLTYSFETSAQTELATETTYGTNFTNSFEPLSDADKALARQAINDWANASGITVFEAPAGEGDVRFGKYDFTQSSETDGSGGFGFYPGGGLGGDVFINSQITGDIVLYMHEVGHALGFKHPFDGDPISDTLVGQQNTVMSYGAVPTAGLLPFDLQAVAHVYGAQSEDGTEVSSYSWNSASGTLTQTGFNTADALHGVGGLNIIHGGDGGDTLLGADLQDTLTGDAGDDSLNGGNGSDSLAGGAGNDTIAEVIYDIHGALYPTAGNNTLAGGDGNDWLFAGATNDSIVGGNGDDLIFVLPGHFNVDGGAGSDTLYFDLYYNPGAFNFNLGQFYATSGNSIQNVESVVVYGGDLADTLTGSNGAEILIGLGGDDSISTLNGADEAFGGDGADTIVSGVGDSYLNGEAGDDLIISGNGAENLWGSDGNDTVSFVNDTASVTITINSYRPVGAGYEFLTQFEGMIGSNFADSLTGDTGANTLQGSNGDDSLSGMDGGDSLSGGNGADTLDGGAGADTLSGGAGTDAFRFGALADANGDRITDYASGEKIILGQGLTAAADVKLTASGGNTLLQIDGDHNGSFETSITLTGAITGTIALSSSDGLTNNVIAITTTGGGGSGATGGPDTLLGKSGNDTLSGLDGNDYLQGLNGNDSLLGGPGDDTLRGGAGDDTLSGVAGNDVADYSDATTGVTVDLSLTTAQNTGWGNDSLASVEKLNGSSYNDLLSGRSGVDTILGRSGDDTVHGGTGNDSLDGSFGNDSIDGGGGSDTLAGDDGDDVLSAVSGNDNLSGGNGNDTVIGGTGADTASGGDGNDSLSGADGADSLSGNAGNDTLNGGTGNDTLSGGADNDSIVDTGHDSLSGGAGNDTFVHTGTEAVTIDGSADNDVATIDHSANGANLTVTGLGSSVTISDGSSVHNVETVKIVTGAGNDTANYTNPTLASNSFDGGGGTDTANLNYSASATAVHMTEGSSGSSSTSNGVGTVALSNVEAVKVTGSAGADTLASGSAHGQATLAGGAGDDSLSSSAAGHDSLAGGAGNDTLVHSGAGTFAIDGGADQDTATVNRSAVAGAETVTMKSTLITFDDGSTVRNAEDVHVTTGAGDDTLKLAVIGTGDYAFDGGGGTNNVRLDFTDKTTAVTYSAGEATTAAGGTVDLTNYQQVTIFFGSGNDSLMGGSSSDSIAGQGGNDTLDGGAGTDKLTGGTGADQFRLKAGDGLDTVTDFSLADGDKVGLATGTAYTVTTVAGSAVIDIGGGDHLTLTHITAAALGAPADWLTFF